MYEIIKSVIVGRNYELKSVITKIKTLWVEGDITDSEKEELVDLARENAKPENSYAPMQEQLDKLAIEVKMLKAEVDALKKGGTSEEESAVEYPEYVQPTGGHDTYKAGDKVMYKGKKYECQTDGCVWSPDDYPQGWREVTE